MKRHFPHSLAAALIGAFCLVGATAASAEDGKAILDKWYPALFEADADKLAPLLADDATIVLDDLGVTQSKEEFIDSLDEWAESTDGAEFKWKLDPATPATAETASAIVCYKFPDNEMLIHDDFVFNGGKIEKNVQTTIAESCADYDK